MINILQPTGARRKKHFYLSSLACSSLGALRFAVYHDAGDVRSSVVRASGIKSEDPGFDPLAGQGDKHFSLSLRVNICADLFVPGPLFVCTARTQMCAHVEDPISICRKRVGLTADGMETRQHCTQGKRKAGQAASYYVCSRSPGKAAPIFRALHLDKKVM